MKVLVIGQLPKDVGGNFTTGAAKVVYELSKQTRDSYKIFTYATNLKNENAEKLCTYPYQYNGYSLCFFSVLFSILIHPLRTCKEWQTYKYINENPLRLEFYKQNFKKVINRVQPDIIHLHGVGSSALRFALRGNNIPVVVTMHGVFYRGDDNDVIIRNRYFTDIKMCDYYTGLTSETDRLMKNMLKIPAEKMSIIPNGVDTNVFYYDENARLRIRNELQVDGDITVFITVASVQERKGQMRCIKMLEKLNSNDWQYWIVGTGPDLEPIKQYCEEHGLTANVKILGFKYAKDLYKYYSAADIYAYSSTMEGQALSEMEAYATGMRVLANKDIEETIVTDVNNAEIYHVIDFADVNYQALEQWLQNKSSVKRISRTDVDWKRISDKYEEYFNNILKEI